jgi:hypothetical protein
VCLFGFSPDFPPTKATRSHATARVIVCNAPVKTTICPYNG